MATGQVAWFSASMMTRPEAPSIFIANSPTDK
jgi:hypothetical protein